jgi:hypothetical protein
MSIALAIGTPPPCCGKVDGIVENVMTWDST